MTSLDQLIEQAKIEYKEAYARYLDLVRIKTLIDYGGQYEIPQDTRQTEDETQR